MRVIADHLRAATFLAVDGVMPSNKRQGYVMRRLMRRAIRYAFELGIEQGLCEQIAPTVIDVYQDNLLQGSTMQDKEEMVKVLAKEEKAFSQTLNKGLRELAKFSNNGLTGQELFILYDTYGFPVELSVEEAKKQNIALSETWQTEFDAKMQDQRERSRTAAQGVFKGGLADSSEMTTKYHTTAHLLMAALRQVLGEHVSQKGSNITAERLRLDFSHPDKVTPEQITQVENIVNEKIAKDLSIVCAEQETDQAISEGAQGVFGHKYGNQVKVYSIGNFSKEICGGPHIEHTAQLAESADGGSKKFKIIKEESSSAGVRRIKAVLS